MGVAELAKAKDTWHDSKKRQSGSCGGPKEHATLCLRSGTIPVIVCDACHVCHSVPCVTARRDNRPDGGCATEPGEAGSSPPVAPAEPREAERRLPRLGGGLARLELLRVRPHEEGEGAGPGGRQVERGGEARAQGGP